MTQITSDERKELEALRYYRQEHEGKAINRAFARLEQLMALPSYDPVISRRAFMVLADCLIALKEENI